MIDEGDLINAFHEGNFAFLTDLVRDNAELEPEVRALLADMLLRIIKGELKLPEHRPALRENEARRQRIAERVVSLQNDDWPVEAAVNQTAKEFGRSERWVWGVLGQYRREHQLFMEAFEKLGPALKGNRSVVEVTEIIRQYVDGVVAERLMRSSS